MHSDHSENQSTSNNTIALETTSVSSSKQAFTSGSQTMNTTTKNPVLEFVLNVADTAKYIWQRYAEWIIDVSWGKLFLACLLTLIAGGLLSLHALANWLVIGSLLLKCFIGKDNQAQQEPTVEKTTEKQAEEES
ncbi:hypothetical protein H8K52_10210 [Undibacterium seohonense]|jgi:hypothetical protein|uniref:Uncharacterized protein n=1 Tax=Undibacterium seohonense TaxID=1344950 RepID=A0ABR6X4K4_9BURK|nr:hypothetical protein [Undibacterium seohonense]MBC3807717.1 hypothetical protein [Undibacterium seohonense]